MTVSHASKHSGIADWVALTRAATVPTLFADAALGVALAFVVSSIRIQDDIEWTTVTATAAGLASFSMAGSVLNGIVDRRIDARDHPDRPIAARRIRPSLAWTAFVILMWLGFALWPSFAPATWWTGDAAEAGQLAPSTFSSGVMDSADAAVIALNAMSVVAAASVVLSNCTHARTAWSVLFLGVFRFLVPVVVMTTILWQLGWFGSTHFAVFGALGNAWPMAHGAERLLCALLFPLAIAIHATVAAFAARRHAPGEFATHRCAACGYLISVAMQPARCSECGCSLATTPPIGEHPVSTRDRMHCAILAGLPLLPVLVWLLMPRVAAYHDFGLRGIAGGVLIWIVLVPVGMFRVIIRTLAALVAAWFVIACLRGLRAARVHGTRKPGGIAAVIAASALLDAVATAMLGSLTLSAACVALWVATRVLQRRIPGS